MSERLDLTQFDGHTPGPWRLAPASDYAGTELNIDAGLRGYVAVAGHRGDAEAEANAALIAAAPALLAELREARALLADAVCRLREVDECDHTADETATGLCVGHCDGMDRIRAIEAALGVRP